MPSALPIRVLCVDDHPVVRDGIALMLQGHANVSLVASAGSGAEAIAKFHAFRPDVTLMDLRLPDRHGSDVIAELAHANPRAQFIALTTYTGDVQARRALQAGAAGYLLKSSLRTELIDTIHAVHAGHRRISPEIAASISAFITAEKLSEREMDVLREVSQGHDNSSVATRLNISKETVRGHLSAVYQKLGARDRVHAVVIAMERGMFTV